MRALSALTTQRLIGTIAALGLVACSAGAALSQGAGDYPNKLVRMIVPFAAGASTDLTAGCSRRSSASNGASRS